MVVPNSCGVGVPTVLREPAITEAVCGAVWAFGPRLTLPPWGWVFRVRPTVFGSRRSVAVSEPPLPSVAVRVSVIHDGYSWSGAGNDAEATPAKVCSGCTWHEPGSVVPQWSRSTCHDSRDAGRAPLSGSVAEPENEIVSPTAHDAEVADGGSMVATGGAFPAFTVSGALFDCRPPESVTRRRTW